MRVVSCCCEPSQPQRILSGLKANFNLCPSYSFHKSLYHKFIFQTTIRIHNFEYARRHFNTPLACGRVVIYTPGNTIERAIKTEVGTRTEQKEVGNLGWFMSLTYTVTSPPREREPAGTQLQINSAVIKLPPVFAATTISTCKRPGF